MAFTLTPAYAWTDGDLITAARLVLTATPTLAAAQTYAFGDGTAAAPSVSFNSDSDNGFYYVGANSFGVACGGSSIGFFNTSGLQGCAIGATSASTGSFTSLSTTLGLSVTGGSPGQGTLSYGATNGFVMQAKTGSSSDFYLASAAGGAALTVPTGTSDIALGGALRLGNAYAAGVVAPTGTMTIKDSTGTSYRVACAL